MPNGVTLSRVTGGSQALALDGIPVEDLVRPTIRLGVPRT